ncbi:hypothetical protein NQ314_009107 [Rhamnusium bicolor]|uniref:Uncharacterized protein n=1 Tax=Rhamnusium bicolor TaxID=1586634 RepID=A0AAV8Y3W8_9CUCU|nr:hypothetical protein NQ314_009107 [Rhamnusium bicolor]
MWLVEANPERRAEKGNFSVDLKYGEPISHYTHAVKLYPLYCTFHNNRSFAFLNVQQYHHATEDHNESIQLKPSYLEYYIRKN